MTLFGVNFFPQNEIFYFSLNVAFPTLFARPGFVIDIEFKSNVNFDQSAYPDFAL
jgi:hypothetical protein